LFAERKSTPKISFETVTKMNEHRNVGRLNQSVFETLLRKGMVRPLGPVRGTPKEALMSGDAGH
jgi:hypothetical protein